jgi:CBS domain-containing protein
MKVADVMTRNVVTVTPGHSIRHAASIMLENRVSGLPVVDADTLVGMITEGDLLRRTELGTDRPATSWTRAQSPEGIARDYVRSHSWKVGDVMTKSLATTQPDADLAAVAPIMLARNIKRLPVLGAGRLVGVISRADLLQAIIATPHETIATGDEALQRSVHARLQELAGVVKQPPIAIVANGTAHLWGTVQSDAERDAIRVVLDAIPGLRGLEDHLSLFRPPPMVATR